MPSRMTGSGQEALPDVRWVFERTSWMSGSGQEALPNVREALSDVRELSGGSHRCPLVVRRPSQMSVRPFRCSRVVGRPTWMSLSGREALPDFRE